MRVGRLFGLAMLAAWSAAAAPPASVLRTAGEVSPLGWPYSAFSEGTLDGTGRLVFAGTSTAIFSAAATPFAQRLGAGSILPDGRQVSGVGPPALTADGCIVARATFESGGEAIVRSCGTTFTVLLDAGAIAPAGGTIRAFDPRVLVAGTDTVAALATLQDGTSVVLRQSAGATVELARSGNPAPSGGAYAAFRLLGVTLTGTIGFRATVSDGPDGLFAAGDGGIHSVALIGQGSPAGGSFASIGGGSVHPGGRGAFRASLSTGKGGVFSVEFTGPIPLLRSVALDGDALPIQGATIRSFPGSIDPSINADGTIVVRALIAGATDPPRPSGIFTVTPTGGIALIAAVRDEFPGIGTISRLRDPVIADDGSVLVSATLGGTGSGLFVSRNGTLTSLARFGDATAGDTGDARFRFGSGSVVATAEGAAFLGERDAVFRTATDGSVAALAYTGRPGPLGGVIAMLGSPVVDGRGTVYFGADFEGGRFNETLLAATATGLDTFVAPDRRLLGGGGIRELFPTSVDALARPAAGPGPGVAFTAALQGAKASEAVFLAKSPSRVATLARVGQRAGSNRLANLGTPSLGPGGALALLAQVGRDQRRDAIVARVGGRLSTVALAGSVTRTRTGGHFDVLGPPAPGRAGAFFHATLDVASQEGVFVGRGTRIGVVAATGDFTTTGGRLRSFDDPIAVGDQVWFLARIAGSVAPGGLYRAQVARVPRKGEAPVAIEPVLVPGDPAPAPIGGVIVRLDAPRVGPSGIVTVVAGIGGGTTSSAILQFVP